MCGRDISNAAARSGSGPSFRFSPRPSGASCAHRLFFAQVEHGDNALFHRRAALDPLRERPMSSKHRRRSRRRRQGTFVCSSSSGRRSVTHTTIAPKTTARRRTRSGMPSGRSPVSHRRNAACPQYSLSVSPPRVHPGNERESGSETRHLTTRVVWRGMPPPASRLPDG